MAMDVLLMLQIKDSVLGRIKVLSDAPPGENEVGPMQGEHGPSTEDPPDSEVEEFRQLGKYTNLIVLLSLTSSTLT